MQAIGIRELKNRLSHYVRLVRGGEVVLVTDRGEVVAELRPPGTAAEPDLPPKILEMARRGELTLPSSGEKYDYPLLRRIVPEGTAQRLLDEERGAR